MNQLVVSTGYMSALRNKPLNVGDKLRRYEKMDIVPCLPVAATRQTGVRRYFRCNKALHEIVA